MSKPWVWSAVRSQPMCHITVILKRVYASVSARKSGFGVLFTVPDPWRMETDVRNKIAHMQSAFLVLIRTCVFFLLLRFSVLFYSRSDCGTKILTRMFSDLAQIQLIPSIFGLVRGITALQRALVTMQNCGRSLPVSLNVLICFPSLSLSRNRVQKVSLFWLFLHY